MRRIIAALTMSVDGFIAGPNGEVDWIESWDNPYDGLFAQIDTCILGRGMYPGYEQYWLSILANPGSVLSTGKVATKNEIDYAHFADKTPHIVLSRTLDTVNWKTTRIVRDVEEIRNLKRQDGRDMFAVGGATLVSSLMNHDLIDELRLVVNPLVLGGGKALFKDVNERHALALLGARPLDAGRVSLTYSVSK